MLTKKSTKYTRWPLPWTKNYMLRLILLDLQLASKTRVVNIYHIPLVVLSVGLFGVSLKFDLFTYERLGVFVCRSS